jgi:ABC-type transport system substrate-binding protein
MHRRLWSRRATLQLGLSAGVASLVVACTSSVPAVPVAATVAAPAPGQPKQGGTFTTAAAGNPPDLDPYSSGSEAASLFASYSYSRLFMLKSGPGIAKGSLDTVGDAAESAQVSDDGLTYTIKLRPNVRWHAPLDRAMIADDVVFSWDRFLRHAQGDG